MLIICGLDLVCIQIEFILILALQEKEAFEFKIPYRRNSHPPGLLFSTRGKKM